MTYGYNKVPIKEYEVLCIKWAPTVHVYRVKAPNRKDAIKQANVMCKVGDVGRVLERAGLNSKTQDFRCRRVE